MRRLAVILCSVGLLGSLAVALATAASGDDPLEFGIVGIDARVGGDAVRSSGVVIDAHKVPVLPTAHSVWGATSLRLTTGVGVLHGRIVARAPCSDLALLEMQPRIPGLVAIEGGGALGHPLDVVARGSSGSIVHLHRPAAVGAPVIDADGRIA